jgi:omega-6 fatty acid desaturase (delta-12 desaturase)
LGYVIGYKTYLLIQIPILVFAGMAGIWLFYVQHQFEEAYWKENEDWNLIDSALFGSSYYKLPGLLQWFTGNIGLHHIHHMRPRIPNYFLQKCQEDIPCFRNIKPLTIISSLKTIRLNLWDEDTNKMVSFRSL